MATKRTYTEAQRENLRAYQSAYHKYRRRNDPAYVERASAAVKRYAKRNPDRIMAANKRQYAIGGTERLAKRHAITADEYVRRIALPCEICGAKLGRGHGRMHLDHDHQTDAIRGTLCHRCNVGLGHYLDDPARIDRAAAYLRRYAAESVLSFDQKRDNSEQGPPLWVL